MAKVSLPRTAAIVFLLVLGGCASTPRPQSTGPRPAVGERTPSENGVLQCVPYAREKSGIQLYGDAYTWWDQAAGRYRRQSVPAVGSVMILYNYAGSDHAHLAVVRRIVGVREIRVDHANWLNDGAVYENNPVYDVSSDNDWSVVRIYNIPAQNWGVKTYPVQGFVTPAPESGFEPAAPTGDDALTAMIRKTLEEANGSDSSAADAGGGEP